MPQPKKMTPRGSRRPAARPLKSAAARPLKLAAITRKPAAITRKPAARNRRLAARRRMKRQLRRGGLRLKVISSPGLKAAPRLSGRLKLSRPRQDRPPGKEARKSYEESAQKRAIRRPPSTIRDQPVADRRADQTRGQ